MIVSPRRILFRGDRDKSEALIGRAKQVMLVLENIMRLRGLQQHSIRVSPYPGAWIICSKVFGMRTVEIVTPVGGGVQEEPTQRWCLCNCNFAVGFVMAVREEKLDDTIPLYDVMVCQGADKYVLIENVLASDFTLYEEGFAVLVIPYYRMGFLCCTGGDGFATGCKADRSLEGEGGTPITDEDWRSTVRIIPWCGFALPKWVRKKLKNNG